MKAYCFLTLILLGPHKIQIFLQNLLFNECWSSLQLFVKLVFSIWETGGRQTSL